MFIKKSLVFLITMVLLILFPACAQEINIKPKDYNTLQIYIKLKLYKGKKFFHENGQIYTKIDDLKKAMEFTFRFDKENNKLFINEQEYTGEHILKNEKIVFIPLADISRYLGYKVNYDAVTNIMDISTSGVITNTIEFTPPARRG
ncbi:MAG: hypothetical protein ABRQ37_16215 [Candidatus Eremiobacterota bacterium]